ncbi:golgin subfamily A member 6-like protein 22 [Tachysurus ichikawai]
MPPKVNKSANASQPHLRPVANAASPPRGATSPSLKATPVDFNVTAIRTELLCTLREEIPAIFKDCANILKKARELQQIKLHNMTIAVFPDYTAKTAQACAAFNEVRRQQQDIEGVRFGIPPSSQVTHHIRGSAARLHFTR